MRDINLLSKESKIASYSYRSLIKSGIYYVSIIIWLMILSFPLYWMGLASVQPTSKLYSSNPSIVPDVSSITFQSWQTVLNSNVISLFWNTLIVATGVICLTVFVATMAGYGLTRYEIKYKITFSRLILVGYMLAPILLAIPMYIMFRSVGMLNKYIGLILALSTLAIPFSVWLMWNMFQSTPISQEEAAWVQGASKYRTFRDIAVPNVIPGIFSVAIFSFAIVWTDFTYSRILLPNLEKMTLSPGLILLSQQGNYINQSSLMAVGTIMTLIPIGVAYFLNSYIMEGFAVGR